VLKPKGKLYFLEHGQSPEKSIKKWQDRLNPIQKIIGDGCHLNRNMEEIVGATKFKIKTLKKFYFEKLPKLAGYCYMGIAQKN